MEKQLSLELKILSSGKQPNSSPTKHLSRKIVQKPKQKNQERQFVKELLPKKEKESKLKALSLEGVETEESTLKETPPAVHSSKKKLLIDNRIHKFLSTREASGLLGVSEKRSQDFSV